MLDRAERLQRQFSWQVMDAWEPPIDVVESGDELRVHVALPGVRSDSITLGLEPGAVAVSALRDFPSRGEGARIHRIEIPYGRFERRIGLGTSDFLLVSKALADGVLTLVFRRKEGA